MTRKRTRESLGPQLCEPCVYCEGRGYVISAESVAFKVLREIRKDIRRVAGREIVVSVNPRVAEMLLGPARRATHALGESLGREIEIRPRPGLHQEQFEVTARGGERPVSFPLRWLEDPRDEAPARPEAPQPAEAGSADAVRPAAIAAPPEDLAEEGEAGESEPGAGDDSAEAEVIAGGSDAAGAAVDGPTGSSILPRFRGPEET